MSEIPTYTDIKDLGLDVKVLQNIEANPATRGKAIYIQNIRVNAGNEFDNIVAMVNQYGGLRNFIRALYLYVIDRHDGNLSRAADILGIPRQTLSEFRKRLLSHDGRPRTKGHDDSE